MNNFFIEIFQNGSFQPINGTAVFPFNFGELLDEAFSQITTIATRYKSQERSRQHRQTPLPTFQARHSRTKPAPPA